MLPIVIKEIIIYIIGLGVGVVVGIFINPYLGFAALFGTIYLLRKL
jgi:uncharacterized protein YebE (UPF0316 family)